MRYYREIIADADAKPAGDYHYHTWTSASIGRFWSAFVSSPVLRRQFYPPSFWEDLLRWAAHSMARPPRAVLDMGCGTGTVLSVVGQVFPVARLIGVDISDAGFDAIRRTYPSGAAPDLRLGILPALPVDDGSVELALCTEVLEHLEPEAFNRTFGEVARILAPGGYFLASTPFEQRLELMACPECAAVFTPNQHLLFEITRGDVEERLKEQGLTLVAYYAPVDHSVPRNALEAVIKRLIIATWPRLARRIFGKPGVTGFLARKA